ncbi:MAG TPA: MFS transporter [Kofleriaceae bacterium]|jgi:MFS family permease
MLRDRRAILALLTALNFLNFIDRAVIAAVLTPMKAELALSNFEAGLLNTAFLIGYFATCPVFGARADKGARKGLIALGVLIWSVATIGSGLATGFWSLLAARIVVGVGEASFAVLAPTIIDDITPPDRKGSALSVFYLAVPLGYALGYILGGTIARQWEARMGHELVAGWRASFLIVGGPGIVLALTCLLVAEPARKLLHAKAKLIDGLREIVAIPLFRRAVLGYCAFTAAVAGFSYWAPDFLLKNFPELTVETANQRFGLVLIVGGAIGTMIGGRYANRAMTRHRVAPDEPHDSIANKRAINGLLRICAVGMAVAAPVSAIGFFVPGATVFFIVSFVVDIALFASTSPVNTAFLRSVPPERRASAMAASIFSIHMFGDLWSAAALGLLLDNLPAKIAMQALPLTFALSAYVWSPRRREAAGSGTGAGTGAGTGSVPEARVHTAT